MNKTNDKPGQGFKAGVGRFQVYLTGPMTYEVRNGHAGRVVGTKPNLSSAVTLAQYYHQNPETLAL